MPNGDVRRLRGKIEALQLNIEGLLKLLGGDEDDRERFWEIVKGITTPVEYRLIERQIDGMVAQVHQVQVGLTEIEQASREITAVRQG